MTACGGWQIAEMGLEELLELLAAVEARLAELGGDGEISGEDTPPKSGGALQQAGRGGWVELKIINGCGPYAYARWLDGKIKRSRYIGKVRGQEERK
jgi:hypothetical protein